VSSKLKSDITHITPVGGNIFADLGFEPKEAAALKAESDRIISERLAINESLNTSEFVQSAVARMQDAPLAFNQEERDVLASYEGLVVSGDPQGRIPDNLEADDNE